MLIVVSPDAMRDGNSPEYVLKKFVGNTVEVWAHGLLVGANYGEITEVDEDMLWLELNSPDPDGRLSVGVPIEDIEKVVYL